MTSLRLQEQSKLTVLSVSCTIWHTHFWHSGISVSSPAHNMTYGPFLREREETVLQAGWGWSTTFQPNWVRTVGRRWETERTVTRGGVCSLPWIPIVVGAERQEGNHAAEQLYLCGDERGRSHQGLRQSQNHMVTQIYPRLHPPAHTHTPTGMRSHWRVLTENSNPGELTEQREREVCWSLWMKA